MTNVDSVFAIGDCAEISEPDDGRRSIEAVWYTGKMMGETVAKTICNSPTPYHPGMWYNSAKFFDIEYQVYGDVPAKTPEGIKSIYWQHATENKAIRINYHAESGHVTGFNLMGIRFRHRVCDTWIKNKTHIDHVLSHLEEAHFDPEFYTRYYDEAVRHFKN